jgi:hypothetical protein
VIPIFILFIGAALYAWMKFNSGNTLIEKQPYEFYYELLCLLVGLLGLVIRAYTVGHTPGTLRAGMWPGKSLIA